MINKKVKVRAVILVVTVSIILAVSLSSCAGGEIGFSGRVISTGTYNDRYFVTAEVTRQADVSFLQKKLPDVIIFDANDFLYDFDEGFEPGDSIDGCYLAGTITGNSVRVVSIVLQQEK